MLLGDALAAAARLDPDRLAVTCADETITYGELDRRANAVAHALAGLGVRHGDVVATVLPSSVAHVEIFAAAARLGAVFAPLNPRFTATEAGNALNYLEPRIVLSDKGFGDLARSWWDGDLAVVGGGGPGADLDADTLAARSGPVDARIDPADVHAVFLTSGSTGRSKGVALSHRASWLRGFPGAGTRSAMRRAGGGGVVCMFPLFHWAGWQWVMSGWLNREPVHLVGADPDALLAAVERWQASELYCIPAVWRRVLDVPAGRYDTSSLVWASSGTSAVSPALVAELHERFPRCELSARYGSTEAGGVCASVGEQVFAHPGSVGPLLPGYSARVSDAGELEVSGPMLMNGYFRLPEATAEVLRDGWYSTGDLVEIDDGFVSVVGRRKEVIRTGGETVAPVEVEAALASYPGIREVAVVGLVDEAWGECVCAVVVMEEGVAAPAVDVLRDHAEVTLAAFKRPRRVVAVDALPRTSATGQVQRTRLADVVAELLAGEGR